MSEGVSSGADQQQAAGFAAGRKWAQGPAEFMQLQRIVEKMGKDIGALEGPGAAAAIAAACFDQPAADTLTRRFWSGAAAVEQPAGAFVRGFYEGLWFVFDEMIITAIR